MTAIRWTEPAVTDLVDLREFIAADSQEAALSLIQEITEAPEPLLQFPQMGKSVVEAGNPLVRELIVRRNYRLIYLWRDPYIYILAIVHVKRNLAGMDPNHGFVDKSSEKVKMPGHPHFEVGMVGVLGFCGQCWEN